MNRGRVQISPRDRAKSCIYRLLERVRLFTSAHAIDRECLFADIRAIAVT
jgi:hypothetical protein